MADFEAVLETRDLGPGRKAAARAHGRDLVLINIGQRYYALDAHCPDDGTNLAEAGRIDGFRLVCPEDQAAFDVRTGERADGDGPSLQRYALRVEDNVIIVAASDEASTSG